MGDQTVVSRIVGMVEASELKKAPIQRYADRFSNYLVPLNFLLCLSVWLVTRNPQKALKMLVIDYSCGIKLSTATAFSAAINTAVKRGVLIKGGAYIEQMSHGEHGAAGQDRHHHRGQTQGGIDVAADRRDGRDARRFRWQWRRRRRAPTRWRAQYCAYGREIGAQMPLHGEIITEVSRGSRTDVGGKIVRVGNLKYMNENGVKTDRELPDPEGAIPNYVGVDDKHCGRAVCYGQPAPERAPRDQQSAL